MTNGNDPAFSRAEVPAEGRYEGSVSQIGLTKREWFAGMAMQGLCAGSPVDISEDKIVSWSISMADALIAALNQKPEEGK